MRLIEPPRRGGGALLKELQPRRPVDDAGDNNHHEAELIVAPRRLFREPNCAWLQRRRPWRWMTPLVAHSLRSPRSCSTLP